MSYELKLESKLLAEESRVYREEEKMLSRKRSKAVDHQLYNLAIKLDKRREMCYYHRTQELRQEARAVNLARGYLRGHAYETVENSTKSLHEEMMELSEQVFDLVWTYGPNDVNIDDIQSWMLLDLYEDEDNLTWIMEEVA